MAPHCTPHFPTVNRGWPAQTRAGLAKLQLDTQWGKVGNQP
jgi:hypothetical protein